MSASSTGKRPQVVASRIALAPIRKPTAFELSRGEKGREWLTVRLEAEEEPMT